MSIHVSLFSASIRERNLIRRYYVYEGGNEVGILITTNKQFTELQPRKSASGDVLAMTDDAWEKLANA